MLYQIKHKFQSASGAPLAAYRAVAMVLGTNSPVRTYSAAGLLIDADGAGLTAADGSISAWVSDDKPVVFVLFDAAGNEVERSGVKASGEAMNADATRPESATLLTGGTLQLTGASKRFLNLATATIAAHTVNLPLAPEDGQEVYLTTRGAITTLTVAAPTAGHVIIAPAAATLAAGGTVGWVYTAVDTSWTRIQ